MSTASLRVHLFPPPPPTNNTLDKDQRSRLLKSTRKLEALLGETPILLEAEMQPDSHSTSTSTWETKQRREGKLFYNSPSCSSSSTTLEFHNHRSNSRGEPETEPGYVLVPPNMPSAPYQVQSMHTDYPPRPSPSSSRSASPASKKSKTKHLGGFADHSPNHSQEKLGSGKGPQALGQPLLLRLRSVPIGDKRGNVPGSNHDAISGAIPINTPYSHVMDLAVPQVPLLSPMSSVFNTSTSDSDKDRDNLVDPSQLTDREKRKKMAKLARTLGENIPPELVFRPTASSGSALISHPPTRSASLSVMGGRPRAKSTAPRHGHHHTKSLASVPALPVAATPIPPMPKAFPPDDNDSPSSSTDNLITTTKRKYCSRPRSLTLTPASVAAFPAPRVASRCEEPTTTRTSLDSHYPRTLTRSGSKSVRVPVPVGMRTDEPFSLVLDISQAQARLGRPQPPKLQKQTRRHQPKGSLDWGRRKERDWSGEWNVRDMEEVVRGLRELKADR